MAMKLQNRTAVITGGSTGIGAATARLFAEDGANVVLADIHDAAGIKLAEELQSSGRRALYVHTDVSKAKDAKRLVQRCQESFGGLHILFNNAGVLLSPYESVAEFTEENFERNLDVNLKGTFLVTKFAVPLMERTEGGRVVICTASGAGVRGASSSLAYGASKGGIQGFCMTLEHQLRPLGIRVYWLCPGSIATPLKLNMIAEAALREGRDPEEAKREAMKGLGDPVGVGRIVLFLASDDSLYLENPIFTR